MLGTYLCGSTSEVSKPLLPSKGTETLQEASYVKVGVCLVRMSSANAASWSVAAGVHENSNMVAAERRRRRGRRAPGACFKGAPLHGCALAEERGLLQGIKDCPHHLQWLHGMHLRQ